MTAAWIHGNQRAIAGLGEITDFLAAHAVTIPAATDSTQPCVVITTAHAHDVAEFAARHHIGASVDCDGRTYADMSFAAAVLRIQAEPKAGQS